jgi:hypothetical protein
LIGGRQPKMISLKKMLQLLVDTLIAQTSIRFNSTIDFKNFKNLRLFVGSGTVVEDDERRYAFYLLINPNESFTGSTYRGLPKDSRLRPYMGEIRPFTIVYGVRNGRPGLN